jgi:uncharacterized protein YjiS (DUF1127 family)
MTWSRTVTKYHGTEIIEQYENDVSWVQLRDHRNALLRKSDWRAVADRELTDEWRGYRQKLRDLPQDWPGDNANDACDNLPDEPEE